MTVDELIASERLLGDLQALIARIRSGFEREDAEAIISLADEFMGYADDLAELGERLK